MTYQSRPTEAEIARVVEIAGDMYWRQRFGLMNTTNVVIVRVKDSASTSPPAHAMARQEPRKRRSASGPTPVAAETRPAPKPAGAPLTQEVGGAPAAPHHVFTPKTASPPQPPTAV